MNHSQQGVFSHWFLFLLAALMTSSVCYSVVPAVSAEHASNLTTTAAVECEGEGCAQVTITWVETKQQYKIQNNSTDRWVKVEAANLAASASLCLGPTKADHFSLSTVVGAFHATLVEESCGKKP
jgi:hypothetical protein